MEWRPEYSVGIKTIDRQHQEILGYIRELAGALESGDGWSITHGLLIQIKHFIKTHFAVEEALLEICDYPDLPAHTVSHAAIETHLEKLERRSVKEDISQELVQFLKDWFISHVLKCDKEYGEHLAQTFPGVAFAPPAA